MHTFYGIGAVVSERGGYSRLIGLILLGLVPVLGPLVLMGAHLERVRSSAQGLNELPGARDSGPFVLAISGLRSAAYLLLASAPLALVISPALALAAAASLVGAFSPTATGPIVILGLAARWLPVVLTGLVLPGFYVHFAATDRLFASLNPVAVFGRVRKSASRYFSAAWLGVMLSLLLAGFSAIWTGVADMEATGTLSYYLLFLLGAFASYLVSVVLVLVLQANWLGQYAYGAYEDTVEHLVQHEYVEALTEDERASLKEGVVAYLDGTRFDGAPVLYSEGEYSIPAASEKFIARSVLKELDGRGHLEWKSDQHRRDAMSSRDAARQAG